jgi:hypothetical protein
MDNFTGIRMKTIFPLAVLLCGLAAMPARAQYAVPPPMPEYQTLSAQQLDQLLGPIALYPDPLMAQILPASTLPTQIVLADRYVSGGGDPDQIDQQPWDASVQAVAHYPNVLKWMDDNLSWTTALGQAFLNQQQDVMDSIQRLRASAQNLGNLQSTPQQQVVVDTGTIDILPTDPDIIYVPTYSPDTVYYQSGYGTPFITFGIGFPIGLWLNCDFDWHHRNLIVWNHDHPRPTNWWHERPSQRDDWLKHQATVWHPDNRHDVGGADRGDRGWFDRSSGHPVPPVMGHLDQHPDVHPQPHPEPRPVTPHETPPHETPHNLPPTVTRPEPVVTHPEPPPVTPHETPPHEPPHNVAPPHNVPPVVCPPQPVQVARPAPVIHPPPNNAFIGIQSPQQTRDFSNRGQQSMQAVTHPAPISHPAPSFSGGGGHSPAPASGGSHGPSPQQKH